VKNLTVRLALDTGAVNSLISREALALIGYDPAVASDTIRIASASGTLELPRITVGRIHSLGHDREGFPIICHTLPPAVRLDGLLGLDFLRGERLVVDFRQGLVSLE